MRGDCVAWKPLIAPHAIVMNRAGKRGVRILYAQTLLAHIAQTVPKFRNRGMMDKEHDKEACCHEYQRHGEYRIDFPYNLIDWQHCGYQVIYEYHDNPQHEITRPCVLEHCREQSCRTHYEDNANHDEKNDRECQHDTPHSPSEIYADKLRKRRSLVAK